MPFAHNKLNLEIILYIDFLRNEGLARKRENKYQSLRTE